MPHSQNISRYTPFPSVLLSCVTWVRKYLNLLRRAPQQKEDRRANETSLQACAYPPTEQHPRSKQEPKTKTKRAEHANKTCWLQLSFPFPLTSSVWRDRPQVSLKAASHCSDRHRGINKNPLIRLRKLPNKQTNTQKKKKGLVMEKKSVTCNSSRLIARQRTLAFQRGQLLNQHIASQAPKIRQTTVKQVHIIRK